MQVLTRTITNERNYLNKMRSKKQHKLNECFKGEYTNPEFYDVDEIEADQERNELFAIDDIIFEYNKENPENFRQFIIDCFDRTQKVIDALDRVTNAENVHTYMDVIMFQKIKLEVIGEIIRDL